MEPRSTSSTNVKKAYWQQQIHNWENSGLSQKMFCQGQSLALSTFSYWKRKIAISKTETVQFYSLSLPEPIQRPTDSGLLLLVGQKRFGIEVKEDFSPTTLKKLILMLEQI